MSRTMLFALAASTTLAGGLSLFFGQGTPVELQPSTPGTQQVGNANVSGRIIAGSVEATDNSDDAMVISGDATSTSGANFGGYFRSFSTLGRALYGRAAATSGTTHGVWGQSDSPAGRGVTGVAPAATGVATGVWGQSSSTSGRGVFGYSTASSGVTFGVLGRSISPSGYGVYSDGNLHATGFISGNGSKLTLVDAVRLGGLTADAFLKSVPNPLYLTGNNTDFTIRGETNYPYYAKAVNGIASATYGRNHGGYFETRSPDGHACVGIAPTPGLGSAFGVYGESAAGSGRGVSGYATDTTGRNYGVHGRTESPQGTGVYGLAFASSGSQSTGVLGWCNSPTGYGVYSSGRLGASGTKSFRIDHPLDPENKYLLHYAAESPMPQNFYVGNVVTDAKGYAWIDLPDYFSEINANFKYQLTVVDDADSDGFVMTKVSKEIRNGRFQVRTSAPKTKVSWRVDADRHDLYVRNRPPKDVEVKEGSEQGTYQHPEFYGLGPERGLHYDPERTRQSTSPLASQPSHSKKER